MTTVRLSTTTIVIITLLIANLGLTTYIAFRPLTSSAPATSSKKTTSTITEQEAEELATRIIPLYNDDDLESLYQGFEKLARVQFSKEQLLTQLEKMKSFVKKIEDFAFSHTTDAGTHGDSSYFTLHYKVTLSGGPLPTGDMTLTVRETDHGLGLYGFFINATANPNGG